MSGDKSAEAPRLIATPKLGDNDDKGENGKRIQQKETDNSVKTSKYTVLNFIPKSLFEQFRRLANIYFLVLSALMMIGTYAPQTFDSPLTPYSTFFPLCVVLGFTMIKEAFEDWKRHQSDKHTDNRQTHRLVLASSNLAQQSHHGKQQQQQVEQDRAEENGLVSIPIRWADIRRGHVIRLSNKEAIPADMVVLATSEPEGVCYVETSNIDGETNLKMRRSVVGLDKWWEQIQSIQAEEPNGRIHSFKGNVQQEDGTALAIDQSSFLLRGSSVQNVKWVEGMVIYAGRDSKLAKNSAKPRLKLSSVEKTMNRLIRMVFGWLFVMVFVSTGCVLYLKSSQKDLFPYLRGSGNDFSFPTPIAYLFTFLILFSNALPMSLYVTVEMVNFGQAYFIDNDVELFDEESNTPARAVTSNLNSDLGQVEYIFSDKTGTLTQNVMILRRCSVGGNIYGKPLMKSEWDGHALEDIAKSNNGEQESTTKTFLDCLAVAHTVQLEEDGSYRAESPDEKALCEGARQLGRAFVGRSGNQVAVRTVPIQQEQQDQSSGRQSRNNSSQQQQQEQQDEDDNRIVFRNSKKSSGGENAKNEETFQVLLVNEFTSARKRMSVLCQYNNNEEYVLFCKGADSVIFARSSIDETEKKRMEEHLTDFANEGLRTLLLARRSNIPKNEAEAWIKEFSDAKAALDDRDEKLEAIAEKMEKDLEILGATAIEDKLQEGVPETLEALRAAGIKIWVLTGDKLETAINIGFSSRLLDSSMRVIRVDGKAKEDVKTQLSNVLTLLDNEEGGADQSKFHNNNGGKRRGLRQLVSSLARSRLAKAARWWTSRNERVNHNNNSNGDEESQTRHEPLLADHNHNNTSALLGNDEDGDDEEDEPLALAITGQALEHAMSDASSRSDLLRLALSCRVVLACRVSPGQKAEMVDLVKKGTHSNALGFAPVTLAIGDGANDVGMIQHAQIGVGISGKEGLQAVNASDFAIAQFRFLRRLLLVHGRWSYRRMAKVVLYSLYKNLVLVLLLFYFQFFAVFSGVSLFESMVQAGYNFFLGMTPLAVGLFDREISARFALQNPQLYVSGRRNLNLNLLKLGWRVIESFVHSAILFCIPIFVVQSDGFGVPASCHTLGSAITRPDGGSPDLYVLGITSYTCLIFVMQYKIMFESSSFTRYNLYAWIFSFALYFAFIVVYSGWFWQAPEFYWVAICALGRPTLWLLVLLCVVSAFVFDAAVRLGRLMTRPHAVDILIERDRLAQKLLAVHELRKRRLGQEGRSEEIEEFSFVDVQPRGFRERVRAALDPNHHELMQRVHSLTAADLDAFGIDSPSLRSSFDFSVADRLTSSSSSNAISAAATTQRVQNGADDTNNNNNHQAASASLLDHDVLNQV